MSVGDKYIMNGVWLTCDKGVTPSRFNVTPKPVLLYDEYFANELDKAPLVNIMPFGACAMKSGSPCLPAPIAWTNVMDGGLTVLGARPLIDTSKCQCSLGGQISIHFTKAAASAAVQENQLNQIDEGADKLETAATWTFWGGVALGIGGAILCATGVGAPLGAAMIVGAEVAIESSAVMASASAVIKGATKFARNPTLENGLSIVGETLANIAVNYVLSKVGGAAVKRLGAWAQKSMSRLGLSERASNIANRLLCTVTGHPVDVISGYLYTEAVDFEFPGPIPLRWERLWNSTSIHHGALGHGWHHSYDLALVVAEQEGYAALRGADGRGIAFDVPALHDKTFNRLEKLSLLRDERGYGVLDHGQGLSYRFGPARPDGVRPLLAVENANGFAITFTYDAQSHLVQVVDSAKRQFAVQCDAEGRVLTIVTAHPTEPRQRVTLVTYTYNSRGELVSAADALGQAAAYQYQNKLLVQETFKNGLSFYFEYAGQGPEARCTRTWGDEGIYDHKLLYDLDARRTVVANSLGYATTYVGNENGLVVEMQDARGGVTLTEYNEFNERLREVDALGQQTHYNYDELGNCTQEQTADGGQTKRIIGLAGELLQLTDVMGNQWQWQYDAQGNVLEQVAPTGLITRYAYQHGLLQSLTEGLNSPTLLYYDESYNICEVQTPTNQKTRALYDNWGRIRKLTDARNNIQWRTYDLLSRIITVHESDGTVRTLTYDASNNLTRETDRHTDVQFAYRGTGCMIRRVEAGTATEFLYDTEEQLRGVINEHGLLYHFTLDPVGDVVTEVGFDGLTRHYVRDVGGRVVEQENPGGRTYYEYSLGGQVSQVRYPDGSADFFRFALDGSLLEARNGNATITYTRDSLGRVLTEAQDAYVVESSYDRLGNRTSLRSSLGAAVQYQYTKAGDITHIQAGNWKALFERDAQGLEVQRTLSGVSIAWQRDTLGRPVAQYILRRTQRQARRRHYQWMYDDRLIQIQDSISGTTQLTHDALGNLAATTYGDGNQQLRWPDAVGNLFGTVARQDRQYGPAGQLLKAKGTRYFYDAEGNLTQKTNSQGEDWHYSWNAAGRLIQVLRPDGQSVHFSYDALGRRLSKRFQNETTYWVWDNNVLLHEWTIAEPSDAGNEKVITWLFEEENFAPLAKLQAQAHYSFVSDYLGTPLELHDQTGEPIWAAELDSYGQVRRQLGEANACPFRYQGQYEDVEIGLYYNRFRYYDPETGQYISQDPIRLDGGLSLYEYVTDTANWADPLGLAVPFELGTYGSLNGSSHVGDKLQAHELLRHEYLVQQKLASKANRLSGNPSIALDNAHHTQVGGAHWHEAQLRAKQGLGRNDFHPSLKRELDITQGGLRKAGVKASTARKLRKQSEKFYKGLLKKQRCPT